MELYYRDAIECTEFLFGNHMFAGHMDLAPYRLYRTAEKGERLYSEWMSGNCAWEMRVSAMQYFCSLLVDGRM